MSRRWLTLTLALVPICLSACSSPPPNVTVGPSIPPGPSDIQRVVAVPSQPCRSGTFLVTLTGSAQGLCVHVGSVVIVSIRCGDAREVCRGPTSDLSDKVLKETSTTPGLASNSRSTSSTTFTAIGPGVTVIAPGPGGRTLGPLVVTVAPRTMDH